MSETTGWKRECGDDGFPFYKKFIYGPPDWKRPFLVTIRRISIDGNCFWMPSITMWNWNWYQYDGKYLPHNMLFRSLRNAKIGAHRAHRSLFHEYWPDDVSESTNPNYKQYKETELDN